MSRKSRFNLDPSVEAESRLTPHALTKQEFGRRLQKLLLEKDWNQSDLSRASGLGRDSISTYINGKTWPTPRALNALSQALGVPKDDLLPNGMLSAMDDEHPAVELKAAAGHPGKAWLRVNRAMSFSTAAKIVELINQEDSSG